MEDLLDKMDPIKRQSLINAALCEFGKNSYDKASTNTIVKEASISKGLLFHYFSSKQALYDYIVDFWFNRTMNDVLEHVDFGNGDLIQRISSVSEYKIHLFMDYPGIIEFARSLYVNKSFEELKHIADTISPNFYHRFYMENVDYTLFREDIDIKKAINITQWTVEKFSEQMLQTWQSSGVLDINTIKSELNEYLNMLRANFYR